jgi:hypothetical protein
VGCNELSGAEEVSAGMVTASATAASAGATTTDLCSPALLTVAGASATSLSAFSASTARFSGARSLVRILRAAARSGMGIKPDPNRASPERSTTSANETATADIRKNE